MNVTNHPRLIARIAGVFYLLIVVTAIFAYLHVRGQLIIPGDAAKTAANIVAHEKFYRMGFSAAVAVVLCNPPMGVLLYELLKVVNPRVALLALVFITISTTIEAVNIFNYIMPMFTLTLPEYHAAFTAEQIQALARGSNRLWGYAFSVSLAFFGVFCFLNGYLLFRSGFFPWVLGVLMMLAGVLYLTSYSFFTFLNLPDIPYVSVLSLIAEVSLALWLTLIGVNETKWRERAQAVAR